MVWEAVEAGLIPDDLAALAWWRKLHQKVDQS